MRIWHACVRLVCAWFQGSWCKLRLTVVCLTPRCQKRLNQDNHSFFAWTAKVPRAERKDMVRVFRQVDRLDRTLLEKLDRVGSPQPASPTHQEQPSMPGSPGQQGPLFTPDQLTQIAQIFRMGIEPVVREMSTRLDSLQAQVTRVPEGTAALHGARPADASLSSGLSSGPSRFGEQPPTSPGPAFRPVGSPPGIAQVTPMTLSHRSV